MNNSLNDTKMSETMLKNILELSTKKDAFAAVKKDIKENPDERYLKRKELSGEIKEIEALICEELDDDEQVIVGKRRFKKARTENVKFSKDRVIEFLENKEIELEIYAQENSEEVVALKAVKKN